MALNITGRKLFVKALKEEGVDTIFAYPGGMITDIVDELYKTEYCRCLLRQYPYGDFYWAGASTSYRKRCLPGG